MQRGKKGKKVKQRKFGERSTAKGEGEHLGVAPGG